MRPVIISVGYTWAETSTQKDMRWTAIARFAKKAAESGRNSAAAAFASAVSTEDDETPPVRSTDKHLRRVNVTRLRASAGRFIWDHISERIREADILMFDVTPVEKASRNGPATSNNVWVEIGYALSLPAKQVFVVHAEPDGHHGIPSDLGGLLIGHIPSDARAVDKSLRAGLAGAVRRLVLDGSAGIGPSLPETRGVLMARADAGEGPLRRPGKANRSL